MKDIKTNAMRILDRMKINYTVNTYQCDQFVDGVAVADMLGQPYDRSFKTLVTRGHSGEIRVFVLPIAEELDMKAAAKAVGEKSVDMLHVKEINAITGYIRGGCTAIGMKKRYSTVLDSSAAAHDIIIVSGGRIGSQIMLAPDDFIRAVDGKYADITVKRQKM